MHGILLFIAVTLVAWLSTAIAAPTDYFGFFPDPDPFKESDPEIFAKIDCSPKTAFNCEGDYKSELFIAEGPCYNCTSFGWMNHESYMPNVLAQLTPTLRI